MTNRFEDFPSEQFNDNKRIAQALNLSESPVKEHVSAVLARMGAHSRVELMTRLRGQRLVRRPSDAAGLAHRGRRAAPGCCA